MNISIRKHIKDNFKNTDVNELKTSIEGSINDNEELALPGLGVFFEVLWSNSNDNFKNEILHTLEENLK